LVEIAGHVLGGLRKRFHRMPSSNTRDVENVFAAFAGVTGVNLDVELEDLKELLFNLFFFSIDGAIAFMSGDIIGGV